MYDLNGNLLNGIKSLYVESEASVRVSLFPSSMCYVPKVVCE